MGEGSKRPVMMVEMERWDRCVMYGVKSYSVVPVAAHPLIPPRPRSSPPHLSLIPAHPSLIPAYPR